MKYSNWKDISISVDFILLSKQSANSYNHSCIIGNITNIQYVAQVINVQSTPLIHYRVFVFKGFHLKEPSL